MGDASVAHVLFRLVCALVVVVGLLAVAMRVARRRGGLGAPRRSMIDVIARQPIGRSAALAVVRAGDRVLVLGVTESAVTLLRDEAAVDAEGAPSSGRSASISSTSDPTSPRTAMRRALRPRPPRMSHPTHALAAIRERTVRRG